MKLLTLLFVAVLNAIMLIGCERQLLSPIKDVSDPLQINTQFAQMALLDLADTATSQGFMNLAEAVTEFVEALATENQTSVQPTFSKLSRLASEVTYLINSFDNTGCSIELRTFAEASVDTIRAYTIRDAADMERALQNLAQEAETASMALQQLSVLNNSFRPFVFGYSSRYWRDGINSVGHQVLGKMQLEYKNLDVGLIQQTDTAVFDLLATKGYKATDTQSFNAGEFSLRFVIDLGAKVDTGLIIEEFEEELKNIPNLAGIFPVATWPPHSPNALLVQPLTVSDLFKLVINSISDRYNKAWCQGNLDLNTIDSILIEESGLDFFTYAFLQNLADIYAEEKPEAIERIRSNMFSFRSIVLAFLRYYLFSKKTPDELIEMYPQYPMENDPLPALPVENDASLPLPESPDSKLERTEKTLDEIIELFRHSIRNGRVHIDMDKAPDAYYYYWKGQRKR